MQLDGEELYTVLETVFPLDVFEVSFVPQAIRSFVHHFYPAYCNPIVEHAKELRKQERQYAARNNATKQLVVRPVERNRIAVENGGTINPRRGKRKVSQWFSGKADSNEQVVAPTQSTKNQVP